MKEFIDCYMGKVFCDFKQTIRQDRLCDLRTLQYSQMQTPDYNIKIIQQFYLLRYFPAYLCEYKCLYNLVVEDRKIDRYNVLSIGCGSYIDYYALYLALSKNDHSITYTGIDTIAWNYRYNLCNPKIKFVKKDLQDINFDEKGIDYNIIFFPKSLGEIDINDIETFAKKLEKLNFSSKYLYIISSSMHEGYQYDEKKHKKIIDILRDKKFICTNYATTKELKDKDKGLRAIDPAFVYPDDIKDFIAEVDKKCVNKLKCEKVCDGSFAKSPILSARYIRFQINLLEKQ